MEKWLTDSLNLVHRSFDDISKVDYKMVAYIFYDYFSDRNLSEFISNLYNYDKMKVYFEIGNILATDYNETEIAQLMQLLKQNGFDEWAASVK